MRAATAVDTAKARLDAAGIRPEEIAAVEQASRGYTSKYPNIQKSEVFDTYKELRSVLSNPDEILPNLDAIVGAKPPCARAVPAIRKISSTR